MFIKLEELQTKSVEPFEGFPVKFGEGSLSAIVATDELAQVAFVHHLVANALQSGPVYEIGPKLTLSLNLLRKLTEDLSGLYVGRVYSIEALIKAVEAVDNDSLVVVSGFPLLSRAGEENVLKLAELVGRKGLIMVLSHYTLELNELDLPSEFRRIYLIPELFDSLLVIRTNSYRGHYRINITVLKAPPEDVSAVGEHSLPADSIIKPLLQP